MKKVLKKFGEKNMKLHLCSPKTQENIKKGV